MIELVPHFLLASHYFADVQKTLFHELQSVDKIILSQSDNEIAGPLLYGRSKFKLQQNCDILRYIKFIAKSEKFCGSIVQ